MDFYTAAMLSVLAVLLPLACVTLWEGLKGR